MKKIKYLHPFVKWRSVLGQPATDLKSGGYMLNASDQKTVNEFHQELEQLMIRIQKSTVSEIERIIQDVPMHFSLKHMCDPRHYQHIADFSRKKVKNLRKEAALSFRRSSWEKYIAEEIHSFPYIGVWGGKKTKRDSH